MQSLSRKFLISVGVMSLIFTVAATVGVYEVLQRQLCRQEISYLGDYVRERTNNVDRRFSMLSGLHEAAAEELERRVDRLPAAEAARLADEYFPLQADGTRRSRPQYFDGVMRAGAYTYGMGAFISRARETPPLEMRALVAAFPLVASFGQAAKGAYDNFYFFTPRTRLVMFGPGRPDRLMFYRHDAPASLDVSGEELVQLTLPQVNPRRATRCTELQRLVQDSHGERLATACVTPVYLHNRFVGAFGSSIDLTGFFLKAVSNSLPGASTLIITGKGQLIAYPGFTVPGKASERTIASYERRLGLTTIAAALRRDGRRSGVIDSPDAREIVAFGRLAGPDWYLLLTYPKATVAASAARSASWVLLVGGLAAAALTLVVVVIARRTIVRPLQRLAASRGARAEVADIEARRDEIGLLARSLRCEREKREAVLASLEDRVRQRTAQLERANAEKSRFLANMSHELRTPLNGVIAVSETLATMQRTRRGRELAELIVSSGRLLERVLTDILDFSKIEAGEIQLADEEFAMETLVRRIAELHRASAENKGLAFRWSVAPEAAGWFSGDTVRLTQVLSNLLSNAVKFTAEGSVALTVEGAGEGVRFVVADSGIGFDAKVKARLFRRFEQADSSIRRRFGGTGLGLSISRSLLQLMGGRIEVESTPGHGSTFTTWVPLLRRSQPTTAPEAEVQADTVDLAACRVLLAEDHPTNQKVVQLVLQSVGVDPVVVENGQEALDALAAARFDVVLMDMQMPELDGLSATAQLRARERAAGLPRTPVIMLTANALDEHLRASHDAGADLHLAKPIRASALLEAIMAAVSAARRDDPESAAA